MVVGVSDDDWFERALQEDDPDVSLSDDVTSLEGDVLSKAESAEDESTEDESTEDDESASSAREPDGEPMFEEDDPFAFGAESTSDDPSGSLFDEDFASALEGVKAPGEGSGDGDINFGFGEPDDTGFDEELDTELPRIDLGIDGLDRMIHGGVPERTLITAIGEAGTGKTTFGLQFLDHGLAQGENAVFITLEENKERVINSATEKGYPFDEYEREGHLAVVDIDPVEMVNSLSSIQDELPVLIEEFGASRLVLDSVSLLEMMYEDRAKRRNEIFDFTRSLKKAGVTTMLTSEASERTPHASRYGIVEYLTDAVFVLQYIRPDDFRETRMAIEIQKIRDANHSREKKPYEITGEGISVYQQANLF